MLESKLRLILIKLIADHLIAVVIVVAIGIHGIAVRSIGILLVERCLEMEAHRYEIQSFM